MPLLKHHCRLTGFRWSLIVCSTRWLVCCSSTPLRPVRLRLSVPSADFSWQVQPQLSRLSPRWNGWSWWLETVEAVRWGELAAGGYVLASVLPVWRPSLQGFRSAKRRGEKEGKYKSRGVRVHERLAWWLCVTLPYRGCHSPACHTPPFLSSRCLLRPCHSFLTLLPVCSWVNSTLKIWSFHFTNKLIFTHSLPMTTTSRVPLCNWISTPLLI